MNNLGLCAAIVAVGLRLAGLSAPAAAQDSLYEDRVQPLLAERCYPCHSHAAEKMRGGLAVDSREALLAGGDSGAAIVPGKPDESLLIDAVKRTGLEMPPEGKGEPLTPAEIELLARWIRAGAAEQAGAAPSGPRKRRPGPFTDEDRRWWAIQPLRVVEPPPVAEGDSPLNEIDRFIRERLRREGLSPAPPASPEVLVRRLTFDLAGLPPTEEEVAEFVAACADPLQSGSAVTALVDRLLQSPRFGERMARHWLDLVRYADSDGYRIDDYRPDAWRYRDYVVRAFNDDKPYDRFVQEQLAGDELFPGDPAALVATGYLRHWIYEYNNRDARGQWTTILNDVTDTTGDVFFGLGLQCARCHDHKFDPILQRDYFRLQAFFAALLPRGDLVAATRGAVRRVRRGAGDVERKDLAAESRNRSDRAALPRRGRARCHLEIPRRHPGADSQAGERPCAAGGSTGRSRVAAGRIRVGAARRAHQGGRQRAAAGPAAAVGGVRRAQAAAVAGGLRGQ